MLASVRGPAPACAFKRPRLVAQTLRTCSRRIRVRVEASKTDSTFVTANGCKLHVRVSGDGANGKPPVLMLHGFPDTGAMWDKQVPALTAAGYKVIVPDLPGFGQSDKPEDVSFYKTENIVGIVLAMLDELKLDKFILVGHDWGAAVAWALVFAIPHRIIKMAVLSVGFPGNIFAAAPDQRSKSWYMLFFNFPNAEELMMANDWALWKQFMEGQTTEEQLAEYISRMSEPGALTAGLNWYRANVNAEMFGSTQPANIPREAQLDMPVLGLWSTGDEKFLSEAGMLASSAVVAPGKWQYQRVEASSHWMMIAEPEKTTKALLEFIGQ